MKSARIYIVLFSIAICALFVLVLWGPSSEEDRSKGYLWKKNWDRIEYKHIDFNQDLNHRTPEKNITFYRKSGLKKDIYFVHAKDSREHTLPVKRKANFNVKNIFSDWRKPEQKGFYKSDQKRRQLAGLDNPSAKLSFFQNSKIPEVTILIGKKIKNGNYLLEVQEKNEEPLLAVVSGHFIDKFRYPLNHFRNKRLIYVASGEYIKELHISVYGASKTRYHLILDKKKKPGENIWNMKLPSNKKIPEKQVSALLGLIKQIKLDHFFDEKEFAALDIQKAWKNDSNKFMDLKIILSNGESLTTSIQNLNKKINSDAKSLALIQSSHSKFTDLVEKKLFTDIHSRLQLLQNWKETTKAPKKIPQKKPINQTKHHDH